MVLTQVMMPQSLQFKCAKHDIGPGLRVPDNRAMNWMRRNRWQAWWVMAWLLSSMAVANAAPWMSGGGALVCSAQGVQWVPVNAERSTTPAQHATWQCSACLPFVFSAPVANELQRVKPWALGTLTAAKIKYVQAGYVPHQARAPPPISC